DTTAGPGGTLPSAEMYRGGRVSDRQRSFGPRDRACFDRPVSTGTFRGFVERAPHVATKIRDGRSRKDPEREEPPLPAAPTGSGHSHSEIVSPRVDPSSPR